VGQDATISFK
nr:RecName: Full=Unknown protein 15 [Pseudotsuga menziesii]